MRVVYASLFLNGVALALKAYSVSVSTSASVDAEFLHGLGDFVNSALLATGLMFMYRKPSIKFPFGWGRTIYVFGLLSAAILGGFLFSLSLMKGLTQLRTMEDVVSSQPAIVALLLALATDMAVLIWALIESRKYSEDPSVVGTVVENLADGVGDLTALMSLVFLNPLIDAYGAFIISGILLFSSLNLGLKYFHVLIGGAAPKNVVGRAIKVAVSLPHVIDVNEVKSLVVAPDEYLLIMEIEVSPDLSTEILEDLRNELSERLKEAEPRIKYLIVEFRTPREPPASFKKLLDDLIRLKE
ncbi:MAG: hypothetical protein DRO10_00575 [Thermoprotei archaeon]|nr:MAG: hypothetical protein DRO10_00575 [Thermoprotei archaeon]